MADQLINWSRLINPQVVVPVLGGFLPPIIWLYFWLKEDLNPEPKQRIIYTFLAGMLAVIPVLYLEKLIYFTEEKSGIAKTFEGTILLLAAWALVEEIAKLLAAYHAGIKRADCDEPIDPPIYLITAALGFAALENVLFLFNALGQTNGTSFLPVLLTGNLRFIGANLLHVATSAFIGISLSMCFFHKHSRIRNIIWGTFIATTLHFFFNYLIIKEQGNLDMIQMAKIMLPLWVVILIIIFILEKIKKLRLIK
jgi:RsiW-degrading membrane proteinase PrsW (M82 family)